MEYTLIITRRLNTSTYLLTYSDSHIVHLYFLHMENNRIYLYIVGKTTSNNKNRIRWTTATTNHQDDNNSNNSSDLRIGELGPEVSRTRHLVRCQCLQEYAAAQEAITTIRYRRP